MLGGASTLAGVSDDLLLGGELSSLSESDMFVKEDFLAGNLTINCRAFDLDLGVGDLMSVLESGSLESLLSMPRT